MRIKLKILRLSLYSKEKKLFFLYKNPIPCYDILSWNLSLNLVENPWNLGAPKLTNHLRNLDSYVQSSL